MNLRNVAVVAGILSSLVASGALAEGAQPLPPQPQPYAQPQYAQPQQGQPVQVVEEQSTGRRAGRGLEYGGHLIVPIWTDSTLNLGPGFGLQGRIGWEFGSGFTAEVNIGGFFNQFDVAGDASLNSGWLGVGARYSILNPSALVPFVGAGLAIHSWEVTAIGFVTERHFTVAFNGVAGFAYELSAQIALEAGVQVNYSTRGKVFPDSVTPLWVSPFLGGTLYY